MSPPGSKMQMKSESMMELKEIQPIKVPAPPVVKVNGPESIDAS
jgi:hypothetical protein